MNESSSIITFYWKIKKIIRFTNEEMLLLDLFILKTKHAFNFIPVSIRKLNATLWIVLGVEDEILFHSTNWNVESFELTVFLLISPNYFGNSFSTDDDAWVLSGALSVSLALGPCKWVSDFVGYFISVAIYYYYRHILLVE